MGHHTVLSTHEWGLEQSGEPGQVGVLLAAGDTVHAVNTLVRVYLALGDTLQEAISMSSLALEGGVDIILGVGLDSVPLPAQIVLLGGDGSRGAELHCSGSYGVTSDARWGAGVCSNSWGAT